MSLEKEQRDILFDACRSIATNKRTPEWISGYLTQAVMKCKQLAEKQSFPESLDSPNSSDRPLASSEPLKVGDRVKTKMFDKTEYTMTIVKDDGILDDVQLWSCGEIEGHGKRADIPGYVIPNVPSHWLKKV